MFVMIFGTFLFTIYDIICFKLTEKFYMKKCNYNCDKCKCWSCNYKSCSIKRKKYLESLKDNE